MAIQKTEAILLRKKDLRETSLILTFFTRDFGKLSGVLKGVRGSRPRSDASPLFFTQDELIFYERKKSDLCLISHCEVQEVFLNILKKWNRALSAYYILELCDALTEPEDASREIFESLAHSLRALDAGKEPLSIARLFEVKLLMNAGLWPGIESGYFKLAKGSLSTLAHFEKDALGMASKIKLTAQVHKEIKEATGKIIADNLDRPLKTTRLFTA